MLECQGVGREASAVSILDELLFVFPVEALPSPPGLGREWSKDGRNTECAFLAAVRTWS